MLKKFYITTTLPYVNADLHIGHALEFIQADAIARYHRAQDDEVFFNTGTDEHGLKIYEKAQEEKKDPQQCVDEYADRMKKILEKLHISYTNFIRTTDSNHVRAAQEIWRRCKENGDIYKAHYKVKYCVGCELPKTDSELENNRCFLHPNREIELVEEENYFFRWKNYQEKLLQFYKEHSDFILPKIRLNEIKSFVERGLEDFSISRLKSKLPWGIPVPGDPDHVMYVWFDALTNYIAAIGWPDEEDEFDSWWPGTQIAGPDNLRQQSAMWQAMLLSAGIAPSQQILIHGFITLNGQKISKSLGNVIHPSEYIEQYGLDAIRYFLLREFPSGEDGDFSLKRLEERYNADLVNGLGNFAARVLAMAERYNISVAANHGWPLQFGELKKNVDQYIRNFQLDKALEKIWEYISYWDGYIEEKKPWQLAKEGKDKEIKEVLENLLGALDAIGNMLLPFMPETAEQILESVKKGKKGEILFPKRA